MTTQQTTPDEVTMQLTVLEQQVGALADPDALADQIVGAINDLASDGDVTEDRLDTIFAGAVTLTETASALTQTMRASLVLARSIQQQRDTVQHKLTALQDAVRTCDYSVPEVEALRESIEEVVMEWQAQTWSDDVWDYIIETLGSNGGLDDGEVNRLLDLLNGDGPESDSDLWAELREWIERAESDARDARSDRMNRFLRARDEENGGSLEN